nr:immunoglobulin heavy chain junction region [Macaca mulatta]
CVRLNTNFDYW